MTRRATEPAPFAAWYPWADRRGRTSAYRGIVFFLLILPGLWLLGRWALNDLGPRRLTEATHVTGDWTIWFLLASLAFTPARAILSEPRAVVVRRMVGLTALAYAGVHLLLYVADQNWRILHALTEIVLRFYLLIGFIALVGLAVLGVTSTDEWIVRLGKRWKQLHRVAYVLAGLGVLHFVLQSKLDISRAVLAFGFFAWLMLWRALPTGRDRSLVALLGLALAAAAVTLAGEWAWYRFATKVDPWRVVQGELDIAFGLRPAAQILALGLLVAGAAELRRLSLSNHAQAHWYHVLLYVGGAVLANGAVWALNLSMLDTAPLPVWGLAAVWAGLFALLGVVRAALPEPDCEGWQARHLLDAFWCLALLYPLLISGLDSRVLGLIAAGIAVAAALALAARLWPVNRVGAGMVLPVAGWIAFVQAHLP